jgi:branched-chain amino acid transport system permease protein
LISSEYKDAVAFLVLLIILFLKPSGILGRGRLKRV